MPGREQFILDIKQSAVDANEAVAAYREEHGDEVAFSSRQKAQAMAERLTDEGSSPVRLQQKAPQDSRDIDAYLVPNTGGDPRQPIATEAGQWDFEVSANQYGSLAETLVLTYSRNPPALIPYIREDIADRILELPTVEYRSPSDIDLTIKIDRYPQTITVERDGDRHNWQPDCVAEAWHGHTGELLSRYWCEIKAGDASFERSQQLAMEHKAERATVLKIRIDLDGLPETYSVRISEVQ